MLPFMGMYYDALLDNVWIALVLFFFVWIYSWAKGSLGSPKLAVLFALIVVYLTFYQYPELVWAVVVLYLLATFGKDLIDKVEVFAE